MNRYLRWSTASLFVLALALPAKAGAIALFNTGVDAGGSPLPGGTTDSHWSIVAGPGITTPVSPVVVDNQRTSEYAQSADSRWIWANADGSGATGLPGYTFRLTFDLTGLDASTATITGAWGVDNVGEIFLNGTTPVGTGEFSLPSVIDASYSVFHTFTITGGFVSGVNTLDFLAADAANPGALNVTNLVGTAMAVPEPASLSTLGVGLVCLMAHARFRRSRLVRSAGYTPDER